MTNKFGEFLREKRKEKGYTTRKLEKKTGVSNSYISQLERGERGTPSISIMEKLSAALDIPFYDMLLQARGMEVLGNEVKLSNPTTIRVPVLGTIPAGKPVLAEENIKEWVDIPNMDHLVEGETFVLDVEGDSMVGSRIFPGDRVVVKKTTEVNTGDIAVVNVNGHDATMKKVRINEDRTVTLIPSNEAYKPIHIKNEDARIIGKVVQVFFTP